MKAQDSITFQKEFKLSGIREVAFFAASRLLEEIRDLERYGCNAAWERHTFKRICKRVQVGQACAAYELIQ